MARRTKVYTVKDEKSRDNGKSFVLTEMSDEAAEWWAFRVLQIVLGADGEINFDAPFEELARQFAKLGLTQLSKADPKIVKPLLDEMMACVSMQLPGGSVRALLPGDIEEVKTRVLLRKELLSLYFDFF